MDESEKKEMGQSEKRKWVIVKGLCLTLQLFAIPSIPPLHLLSLQWHDTSTRAEAKTDAVLCILKIKCIFKVYEYSTFEANTTVGWT